MRPASPDSKQDKPIKTDFLVSFLVDARGGSMTGSRRTGVRVVIPPQAAEQPVRLTIRQLRPDQVLHLPPLSDGEGLASRIIQLTPATFLSPVLVEVPHFASLASGREIVVLRSDNGRKWSLHTNSTDNQNITAFLHTNLTSELVQTSRVTTRHLPHYLAVVSRPRQETFLLGPDGGHITSSVCPSLQCEFPRKALTKEISVGVSVMEVGEGHTQELEQQGGAVSAVVTVEPRRRKFHKPITVSLPLPDIKPRPGHSAIETSLLLMCSMSGAGTRCVWEDVTLSTPLMVTSTMAQFTTVVSAQFWLLRLPTWMTCDKLALVDNMFRLATRTPYLAQIWVYWRPVEAEDEVEMELRVILATEGERVTESNLEEKENFTKLFVSEKMEFLDKSEISLKLTGNLAAVSEVQTKIVFRPFVENRITTALRRQEQESPAVGKLEIVNDLERKLHSMPLVLNSKKC